MQNYNIHKTFHDCVLSASMCMCIYIYIHSSHSISEAFIYMCSNSFRIF